MRNCFCEDFDLSFSVKMASPIGFCHGYFINVQIPRSVVLDLAENGIYPNYTSRKGWFLAISLNNNTRINLNGIRIYDLSNDILKDLEYNNVVIKELAIRAYSKNSNRHHLGCYATKLIMRADYKRLDK